MEDYNLLFKTLKFQIHIFALPENPHMYTYNFYLNNVIICLIKILSNI